MDDYNVDVIHPISITMLEPHKSWQSSEINTQLSELSTNIRKSMANFSEVLKSQGVPAFQDMATAFERLRPFIEQLETKYREVGAPYGDTEEGMMRWLQDLSEIASHERAISEISARHRQLGFLRAELAADDKEQ